MANLFDGLARKVGMIAVDKVLEDKEAQSFFKKIGKEVGEGIPGDIIEPKLNKVIDLIQEGIKETIN